MLSGTYQFQHAPNLELKMTKLSFNNDKNNFKKNKSVNKNYF